MNKEIKAQWTTALRSGDYQQGRGSLNDEGKFCCLGVLCDIAVKNNVIPAPTINHGTAYYDENSAYLPVSVMDWAGVSAIDPYAGNRTLSGLNDSGLSFNEIADIIDAKL